MKRRLVTLLALAAASSLLAPAASAERVHLIEAGGASFPDRSYVLTLPPGVRVAPRQVHVFENGERVWNPTVVPGNAAGATTFGVVLAIDTSNSMRGAAIDAAMNAARAFAARRNASHRLAVVAFNGQTRVLLPFTSDDAKVERVLARTPQLREGTRIYDGVDRALALLRAAGIDSGSIVLLSDGSDVGSRTSAEGVVARAKAAHVRVFSVGLRSAAFYRPALELLAAETGAVYSEATSSADLAAIYDRLGAQLANEYVVRYRSLAGPSKRVVVAIKVTGVGTTKTGYVTPSLPTIALPGPYHHSAVDALMQSALVMVLVGLISAALLTFAFFVLLRPRGGTLRGRMSAFVTLSMRADAKQKATALADRLTVGTEKSLERTRWWTRFTEELEIAEIKTPAARLVLWCVVVTFAATWLLGMLLGPVPAVLGLGTPLLCRMLVKRKLERKRKRFAEQLPDNLEVLASALRAGHSLVGAMSVVVDDAPEPSKSELRRVIGDEQLGVPLEDGLMTVARRMDSRDLEQVALVASLQRRSGGNSAEVLDRVSGNVRERAELRRLVHTLTAQGRMSRWVVSALPVVLLVGITILNPGYMRPFFDNAAGRVLLGFAALMVVVGSLVIKKIINIKV